MFELVRVACSPCQCMAVRPERALTFLLGWRSIWCACRAGGCRTVRAILSTVSTPLADTDTFWRRSLSSGGFLCFFTSYDVRTELNARRFASSAAATLRVCVVNRHLACAGFGANASRDPPTCVGEGRRWICVATSATTLSTKRVCLLLLVPSMDARRCSFLVVSPSSTFVSLFICAFVCRLGQSSL